MSQAHSCWLVTAPVNGRVQLRGQLRRDLQRGLGTRELNDVDAAPQLNLYKQRKAPPKVTVYMVRKSAFKCFAWLCLPLRKCIAVQTHLGHRWSAAQHQSAQLPFQEHCQPHHGSSTVHTHLMTAHYPWRPASHTTHLAAQLPPQLGSQQLMVCVLGRAGHVLRPLRGEESHSDAECRRGLAECKDDDDAEK